MDSFLRDNFSPIKRNIGVTDDLAVNSYLSPEGELSYHNSYGCLRTTKLLKQMADFLAF